MYEWFEKRRSETMLSPLLEEEEESREDRRNLASSNSNAWSSFGLGVSRRSQPSSVSSTKRRLRVEQERRLLRLSKSSCRTSDSEATDYDYRAHLLSNSSIDISDHDDDDDDYEGDVYHVPAQKMKWTDVLRRSVVAVVTIAGIASYLVAFVESLLITTVTATAETVASEWVLGVAGGTCLLTSTLVWRNEVRLSHVVSLRSGLRSLRHLERRLLDELRKLAKEEEALIAEVGR